MYSLLILVLIIATSLCYDYNNNNQTGTMPARRLLLPTSRHRNVVGPNGIKMPYPKLGPVAASPLFSHSVAWKTRQVSSSSPANVVTAAKNNEESPRQDLEVTQFHSQDNNGQVVFGFNSPDQMRFETRNADGSVHGTYSYVDPYGQVVKRQYWDTGAGFHVTSNSYPYTSHNNSPQEQPHTQSSLQQQSQQQYFQSHEFTPEVQVARDLHFQLYQQALSSVLPKREKQNDVKNSGAVINASEIQQGKIVVGDKNNATDFVAGNFPDVKVLNDKITYDNNEPSWNSNDDAGSVEMKDDTLSLPQNHNGTIVIQNPEFLQISWTTDSKNRHRTGRRIKLNDSVINRRALNVNKHKKQ